MKTYIPTDYFKHAGYIKKGDTPSQKDTQSQYGGGAGTQNRPKTAAQSKFTTERFNEQVNFGSKGQKKDEALSAYSRAPPSVSKSVMGGAAPQSETGGRAQSSYFKKRILDKINMMDETELEKMSKNLAVDDKDERASVITQDRLKKFNEIYDYEHGPAVLNNEDQNQEDEEGEFGERVGDLLSNPNEGEEQRDEVHSLLSRGTNNFQSKAALHGKGKSGFDDK